MEKIINLGDDEIYSQQERENILEKVKSFYEKELAEKDRKIDLLLTANREITYSSKSREYNQSKLYKEDFEIKYYCTYHGK